MVSAAWRANERGPPIVSLYHRADVTPCTGVSQCKLRKCHASNASADQIIVSVRPNHLPSGAVFEANEHFLLIHVFPQLWRKCLVYPALASFCVNGCPNGAAALGELWQARPVGTRSLERGNSRAVQQHIVLTRPPVPNPDSTLTALFEIIPHCPLILARLPTIWQRYYCHVASGCLIGPSCLPIDNSPANSPPHCRCGPVSCLWGASPYRLQMRGSFHATRRKHQSHARRKSRNCCGFRYSNADSSYCKIETYRRHIFHEQHCRQRTPLC